MPDRDARGRYPLDNQTGTKLVVGGGLSKFCTWKQQNGYVSRVLLKTGVDRLLVRWNEWMTEWHSSRVFLAEHGAKARTTMFKQFIFLEDNLGHIINCSIWLWSFWQMSFGIWHTGRGSYCRTLLMEALMMMMIECVRLLRVCADLYHRVSPLLWLSVWLHTLIRVVALIKNYRIFKKNSPSIPIKVFSLWKLRRLGNGGLWDWGTGEELLSDLRSSLWNAHEERQLTPTPWHRQKPTSAS